MSDDQNPDLPTAGRRPPPTSNAEDGTAKAVPDRTTAAPADSPANTRPDPGEATTRLTPPAPPAVPDADEPTAALARPSAGPPGEGATVRLPRPGEQLPRPTTPNRGAGDDEDTARLDEPVKRASVGTGEPGQGIDASLDPVSSGAGAPAVPKQDGPARRRLTSAGTLIALLLALFGFTLVVQLRSNDGDQGLASARQEDLVRILSDLDASDSRLQSQINALEQSQRQLSSGVAGRQAALAEAEKRADELGLLAGTLPGRGPGLVITLDRVKASSILNAVQELRGAGGEVLQLTGSNGLSVRIVASSYFVDAEGGGIIADSAKLAAPYTLSVIGQPQTMQTALQIPGGVVASVNSGGGSVTMEQRGTVEVTAVRKATTLQYAKPAS
ncbi:hypothetical protein GCM10010172_61890 [Paractinoplanes ferrugineus]|uniref:DUF881 domain-containing protein n=1 Tax=Paractinoplanes ferrugineus TaxID=113564 RepID=A0A919J5N5_9ACTN|nr:DUF881 domain-containing protein [Actinoplanes ferrugineus]GIE14483.1 hypothetical protein Afe05nite_63230 [Actinoplanes ferrugineus]